MTDSSQWTGRQAPAGSPIEVAQRAWNGWLWPDYACVNCDDQQDYRGQPLCYCETYGFVAPGVGPEPWRVWLRKLPRRGRRWRAGR